MAGRSGRLRRADRLRDGRDFRRLARTGKRQVSRGFVALAARPPAALGVKGSRLGVTVSRKVGKAVVRNRVKRRIREWYRTSPEVRASDRPVDLVVIARRSAVSLDWEETRRELDRLAREVTPCRS